MEEPGRRAGIMKFGFLVYGTKNYLDDGLMGPANREGVDCQDRVRDEVNRVHKSCREDTKSRIYVCFNSYSGTFSRSI